MDPVKTSSPLRILLVEDDEHDRLAFRIAFQKSRVSCEITEHIRGEEALERLRADASSFDLVVIDHVLPGMSGVDLCKVLTDEKTPLPLVILTGRGSEQLAVEALKLGVDDYIIKDPGQGYLDLLPVVLPEVLQKHGDRRARRRAEEALQKAYDELEQRVKERTAKLARTTEQLELELTERKRAEEALRESEDRYRTLFDYAPNSIFVLELGTFKILDVNARALEVYGYKQEELVGKPFTHLGPEEYLDGGFSTTEATPSTLCSVYPKARHRRKDGTPFYVNVYACKSKGGRKYGIIATTVDITESLAKETKLIQAGKMSILGEVSSGIGHELNQPLNVIKIDADFLLKMIKRGKKVEDEELKTVVEEIGSQTDRASGIINHLQDFSRVSIRTYKVDVNKPIRDVFMILGQQLKVREIEVQLDLDDNLPPIMADSNRLEQVFLNLVINARDAIEEKGKGGGKVRIRSFLDNQRVTVTVFDTGKGIPEDIIDKIFEPFFTTKEVGRGTGLGLSVSYGIIKDYGGTVEVKSKAGVDTTFVLKFPAC